MTIQDLKNIEEKFGIKLPEEYKNFTLNYPEQLFPNQDFEFINDSESLIEINSLVYKDLWGKPLSKDYFTIGENGCGDYFILSILDSKVYSFVHDNQTFYITANSLKEYQSKILNESYENDWGNKDFQVNDLRN